MEWYRFAAVAWFLLSAQTAVAEVNWCRLVPLLPNSSMSFEQSAAGLDRLGCEAQPQESAHTKIWKCSDQKAGDTGIILFRVTGKFGDATLVIIRREGMHDLDRFRHCGRSSSSASPGGAFEPGSIAVRDRAAIIQENYRTATLHLLRLGGTGFAVATYPDTWVGGTTLSVAELGLLGITRVAYPNTRVEVAGKNIISSRASDIISALQGRGSTIVSSSPAADGDPVARVYLTPPVGLAGVTKIEISSVADHAYHTVYKISGETDYMTYVRLLDERYGSSTVRDSADMQGCRTRYWKSGHVGIIGAYCRDRGYEVAFLNDVVVDQLRAYRKHISNQAPPAAQQPRIDPDNM